MGRDDRADGEEESVTGEVSVIEGEGYDDRRIPFSFPRQHIAMQRDRFGAPLCSSANGGHICGHEGLCSVQAGCEVVWKRCCEAEGVPRGADQLAQLSLRGY